MSPGSPGLSFSSGKPGLILCSQVVQVYLSWPSHLAVTVPRWQLVAFRRVCVPAGKSVEVMLEVEKRDMGVWWSDTEGWKIPTGAYR